MGFFVALPCHCEEGVLPDEALCSSSVAISSFTTCRCEEGVFPDEAISSLQMEPVISV